MDLPTITTLLSTHESLFRTIISTAKPNISGDALKAKLTSHYINLIVIAGAKYPMEIDTLDDPLLSTSSPKSKSKSAGCTDRTRKRRASTPNPIPMGRTTSYSRPMQPSGASCLFTSRKGKELSIAIDNSDDDSAGSLAEEEDEIDMLISPSSSSRREMRGRKLFTSRAEKERERRKGSERGTGMSAACSSSFSSSSSSSSGSGGGNKREEEIEVDGTGFVSGKDFAGYDKEVKELIQYADEEEEQEVEDADESPRKRLRTL